MRANTENFAFPPAIADRDLSLLQAKWFVVDDCSESDMIYKVRLLSIADHFEQQVIIWREPTEEEKLYLG
jgi:hypothetical protein